MGIMRPQNERMKSIVMAIGASIIVAIGTMFIPVSLLERFTGATGLSELVQATAAPLGDTARALIAFAAGIVTLVLMLGLAMRKGDSQREAMEYDDIADDDFADIADPDFEETDEKPKSLKDRIAALRMPTMPWQKDDDDISDLADLPKLRDHDAHPDAPARRPISALTDLADADLVQPEEIESEAIAEADMVEEQLSEEAVQKGLQKPMVSSPLAAKPAGRKTPLQMDAPVDSSAAPGKPDSAQHAMTPESEGDLAPLADMVAKLERSVEQRKAQLERLEQVAATLDAETSVEASAATEAMEDPAEVETPPEAEAEIEPASPPEAMAEKPAKDTPEHENIAARPPLEAVPASSEKTSDVDDEEMDAALNAALETLQRMNTGGR